MGMNTETTLNVRGMTCNSCVRHLGAALRAIEGVTSVDVKLAEGVACVIYDPEAATKGELRTAIVEAGYEVV
ncbi:copper chaperone CopZ [soil metagenome]